MEPINLDDLWAVYFDAERLSKLMSDLDQGMREYLYSLLMSSYEAVFEEAGVPMKGFTQLRDEVSAAIDRAAKNTESTRKQVYQMLEAAKADRQQHN